MNRAVFSCANLVRALSLIGVAAVVAACATAVQKPAYPQLSYAHLPPIALDVARVEVENRYVPPAQAPNVDHEFPVSPSATALNWGRDRLKAAGGNGVVRLTVTDASVVEVPLKRTTGVRGAFTTDQTERYDAVLSVMVRIFDASGQQRAEVASTAKRSRSVPENVSLNDREKIWFEMTESLMNDLNASLEKQIRTHWANWLR